MIVLVDNYDSFTFNLVHYLGGLGADVAVHRNDKIAVADVLAAEPEAIVLSPGPCTPNEAGICLELVEQASPNIPILGVCLGHQAIGQAFGSQVMRAPAPVHGHLMRKNVLDLAAQWSAPRGRNIHGGGVVSDDFKAFIARVPAATALTRNEASHAFDRMMSGEATPSQMGAMLMAMRVRGE